MKMSRRGGRRAGAGRKPALDAHEFLNVITKVASFKRAVTRARLKKVQARHFAKSDYLATQAKLDAVPVCERRKFLQTAEGSDLLDDVEFARREMAEMGAKEEDAPRLIRFTVSRPYGLHSRIVRKVADWATRRYGKRVTPRSVERAWKEWRSIQTSDD